MLDSERDEHIWRTCDRALLNRYVARRFTSASITGEVPLDEYQYRRIFRERSPELAELLRHPRLLILAEPGGGKSLVARAAVRESVNAGRIPILAELKSYRTNLSDLLRTVAPDALLADFTARRAYILDGIDEVPGECLSDFAKELELLSSADPQATLLATARQAFYVSHHKLFPHLTAVFHIVDFTEDDVRRYAQLSEIAVEEFMQVAAELDIEDQLTNPLALSGLAKLFRATGQLSDRRTETMSAVIDNLIKARPGVHAHKQRRALKMLAVAMEVCSRNELTEKEAVQVIQTSMHVSDNESQEILDQLYASILLRTVNGVAFQLRSYGEYLSAEELEDQDLHRVRELAFLDANTPNDSWRNAMSYLLELNPPVRTFFVRKFPFWVLQSSPAAFVETEKTSVANGVLKESRLLRLDLRTDSRVRIRSLARFVTPTVEEELRQELLSKDDVLCGNAMILLGVLRRREALEAALPIAKDLTRGVAIRQCAMVAIANSGCPANVNELLATLTPDDPVRNNLIDAIGAITDVSHLPQLLDLVVDTDAMLTATYYHFREFRSRQALISVLRYLADKPGSLNKSRIVGYIKPILATLPGYFDPEIVELCADLLRALTEEHVYADRDGPLQIIVARLREADHGGEVARHFLNSQLGLPIPADGQYYTMRIVATITTVDTAHWLIQQPASTEIIKALAGFVQGDVRELLRPYSDGFIDAQDENAHRYAREQEKEEHEKRDRVQQLQESLLMRSELDNALNDLLELTEDHWPELPESFRNWLSKESSSLMGRLDLEHRIEWKAETLWRPQVLPLLISIITRYQLEVVPDHLMVFTAMGTDEQAVTKYFRRSGLSGTARTTLERLLVAPPSRQALERLIRFVRAADIDSDNVRRSLRSIGADVSNTVGARTDALQILAKHGEDIELFVKLRNDPQPAIAEQTLLTLVERQHRATIERELSRLLEDDAALRAEEAEIPSGSRLNWLGRIRAEFAWKKLRRLRERALYLELDRLTMAVTGALTQINREKTALLIRWQLAITPPKWRNFLQARAIELEQATRIEQAQSVPFEAVLRKLRGSTSADKLIVVCEGQTDVPVFSALLAQIPDIPEVIFDNVGGWTGLRNKDPNIFLLGAKEAIVVMDGDNGREWDDQPPSLTFTARQQMVRLKAAGVELRVLERYGIENYFPRDALEKVLQRNLSAFFPLPRDVSVSGFLSETKNGKQHFFYSKGRNDEVASHIDLDRDLKGTDLHTVIYEIAETARRLRKE